MTTSSKLIFSCCLACIPNTNMHIIKIKLTQAQIYTFPTKQPSKNYTFPINNYKKNYTFPINKDKKDK